MRIIVYGSLRRKQGNSHWMTNAQWLGDHQLEGYELYDLGHYPAAVAGEGEIYCEVYRISSSILTELDELKRGGGVYQRELIATPFGSAWIYLYQRPVTGLRRIASGDWLKRHEDQ
ncbi:Gamma-glutamylcyclotransferase family protein YtfP [Dickeya dianthicola]|uniref:Gamma-glutamylcyclotransferase family protein YtfP n=1 Tax=Dickeya dianthicola TaxID=204039 RepID=A0AAP2D3Z5_9GAMM|nr:gamma-glutamylcyclotransferase [Dickeya dianthicola]AYC20413.1 Gamma-glutamylcyclotransferase family protein YtfP [Dickeya dianthicola]MBI0437863.1 gamma-glutamylcyclotransferase [Dickeya dianthicola]MBI0448066.1 gamma-glutamylcyclotransferase [Dickeya dianthicola]MBI0452629.1 gamma-glutamylcyclotransferase [Dickeya dianthicola]MBI0456112.1 gamma-glutamylcyclotransferase [Dickeya dianthicola]